ncbi:hypothetical protein F4777DRAFT_24985 [Nemania sp. FL0916]|nr:hypothetical protein F4777DRAFT_24985 [Nemania sp. FL0916]
MNMANSVPSRLRSYLRRKLEKTKRSSAHASIATKMVGELASPVTVATAKPVVSTPISVFDEQQDCSFFQKLPIEIRKMIYAYVWQGPYDYMYHESNGRHLHFNDGHWVHTRCVMYEEDDEELDFIQNRMDFVRHSGQGDLLLWQRRLASTWGQRHWRCEERIKYGKPTSIDRTDLGALMVTCKKMHPEVMESFIECHKLIFNDVFSAHRFLVQRPSSSHLIRHVRDLDLTLSVPYHELVPFNVIGRPETEDNQDAAAKRISIVMNDVESGRLGAIFTALANSPTCLHSLRIALDVYDRGPWRRIPEPALVSHLERIPVRRGRDGDVNYTVEFPPALPIQAYYAGLEDFEDDEVDESYECDGTRDALPFDVLRRPPLRYWQFSPGEVEHFNWETYHGGKPHHHHHHCWAALSKTARFISDDPYLIDEAM